MHPDDFPRERYGSNYMASYMDKKLIVNKPATVWHRHPDGSYDLIARFARLDNARLFCIEHSRQLAKDNYLELRQSEHFS